MRDVADVGNVQNHFLAKISLDSDTLIEVAYSDERRSLTLLSGRAKFDVAKDPRRPFTVRAHGRLVVATGTVWGTLPRVNRLVRISARGEMSELEPPTRAACVRA